MKKRIFLFSFGAIAVAVLALMFFKGSDDQDPAATRIKAQKGTIIDKALAVGTIEPENEISIKSKISGSVSRIFADAGAHVKTGQPLLEVRPEPTPLELAEAKRN